MTGQLSPASIAAIADLGQDDRDVAPALAAAGIPKLHSNATVRTSATMTAYSFPSVGDDIKKSIKALDLADPVAVERVLRFAKRLAEVYAAGRDADRAKLVRLRNALADDGYDLEVDQAPYVENNEMVGGDVARASINKQAIARMMRDMQREFDKHPIRVPVQADSPTVMGSAGQPVSHTTIYNGPVIQGSANGAQLAWGNQTASQVQNQTEQVAPGLEALAQAVALTLEGLPAVGLTEEDEQDARDVAEEILTEVTHAEPDKGKIRRAVAALKGFLAPVAQGLHQGAALGAQDWARTAIEQLGQ